MYALGRFVDPWIEGEKGGVDKWIAIDQSSIPEEVFAIAGEIASQLKTFTNSKGMFIAVDLFKTKDGRFMIRELNVKDPGIQPESEVPTANEEISKQNVKLIESFRGDDSQDTTINPIVQNPNDSEEE